MKDGNVGTYNGATYVAQPSEPLTCQGCAGKKADGSGVDLSFCNAMPDCMGADRRDKRDVVFVPQPSLHCPFCGIELDDGAVIVTGGGSREWMCNVCGETGLVEETGMNEPWRCVTQTEWTNGEATVKQSPKNGRWYWYFGKYSGGAANRLDATADADEFVRNLSRKNPPSPRAYFICIPDEGVRFGKVLLWLATVAVSVGIFAAACAWARSQAHGLVIGSPSTATSPQPPPPAPRTARCP